MSGRFTWSLDFTTFSFCEICLAAQIFRAWFFHLQKWNVSETKWKTSGQPLLSIHYKLPSMLRTMRMLPHLIYEICEFFSIELSKCTFLLYGDYLFKTPPVLYYVIYFISSNFFSSNFVNTSTLYFVAPSLKSFLFLSYIKFIELLSISVVFDGM